MTEASRGRVTITLGHSGQVVKRSDSAVDADSFPKPGSKRSVRDRLGSNSDRSQLQGSDSYHKRQRGNLGVRPNHVDGIRIGKDDLRFKLMQKNESKRGQISDCKVMDLRARLSRTVQQLPPSRADNSPQMPDPRATSLADCVPSRRIEDNLSQMNFSRRSYSPWSIDHIRRQSSGQVVSSSKGFSPTRNIDDMQGRPLSRAYDDIGISAYPRKDLIGTTRALHAAPFTAMSSLAPPSSKPLLPVPPPPGSCPMPPSQLPSLGSVGQKSPCIVNEQQTVEDLLKSMGLGKYVILFKAEEVDMAALKQMGENDLKELGIPMGPRKKILQVVGPRLKRQP